MWNRAATSSSATQNTPKSTHDATVSPPRRSEICSFALLNSRFAQTLMPSHRFSLPCRHHADEGGFRFRGEALYTVPKCQADRPEHSPSNRCTLSEKTRLFLKPTDNASGMPADLFSAPSQPRNRPSFTPFPTKTTVDFRKNRRRGTNSRKCLLFFIRKSSSSQK